MRFRATLASLLTVIFLSFSSFASNCETRCSLQHVAAGCHDSLNSGQPGIMPAMAGMAHSAKPRLAAAPAIASQHEHCRAHVCAQQPVLITNQQAELRHTTVSVGLIVRDVALSLSGPTLGESAVRGPPAFQTGTPVSLHTTLVI
jgi:hypothetical protein